jgi:hypothetical protein
MFTMPRKSGGFGGVAGSLMDYVIHNIHTYIHNSLYIVIQKNLFY